MTRIKIELIAPECNQIIERPYTDKTGKQHVARSQEAWLHNGQRFPTRIKISIPDKQAPYSPGDYEFAPQAFQIDNFGNVKLNGFQTFLVPLAKQ